jgi:dimethylhistidine N-methyltransferase
MISSHPRFTLIAMDASARLSAFARDVKKGLSAHPKHLSCCYFYDAEGSNLFEEICDLPEYYLPAAEREILQAHSIAVVSRFFGPFSLVELGSGNATKTRILIDAILKQQQELSYVPIDICRTVLEDSSLELLRDYPALRIVAVAGEYHEGLQHLQKEIERPKLILWLGSNIGNFHREEAADFLGKIRETMNEADRLLIGVDLRKEQAILERAYDDSRGVTARFNLNLLTRINRELSGHFDLSKFRHRAIYNEIIGRVEMYLDSLCDQSVTIDQIKMKVQFASCEPIHTENSYKYSREEIDALAAKSGFLVEDRWLDAAQRFSENLLRPLAK